jgi:hypothetical protein
MTAPANLNDVTYVTSEAIHCTLVNPNGDTTYYVIVVESEGYALVQPQREAGWKEVSIGDLDLSDADSLDEIVAAVVVVDEAFGPSR